MIPILPRRPVFDASRFRLGAGGFDVAPDDERFVFARPVGGSDASQLVVVENFFRVLREQVGR